MSVSAPIGAFTFMLHSHLPYARQAGMWPHGEEWVHEAIAETYGRSIAIEPPRGHDPYDYTVPDATHPLHVHASP